MLIASYFDETFNRNKQFSILDKLMTQLSVKSFLMEADISSQAVGLQQIQIFH